jgi:hypothetical protein
MTTFAYAGAAALVALHEQELRAFLPVWKRAHEQGLAMPATEDPSYASREELLRHVMRAARGYMTWICAQLELPDPGIEPTPEGADLAADPDRYMEHVLERWRAPLAAVPEERFEAESYMARWGSPFTIDGMLEHAVIHPLRHAHQLRRLMGEGA